MKKSLIDLWNDLTPWERTLCIALLFQTLREKYIIAKTFVTNADLVDPKLQDLLFYKMLGFERFEYHAVYQLTGQRNLMLTSMALHKTGRISYRLLTSIDVVSRFFQKANHHLSQYQLEIEAFVLQGAQ